jgi:hypothetical protein
LFQPSVEQTWRQPDLSKSKHRLNTSVKPVHSDWHAAGNPGSPGPVCRLVMVEVSRRVTMEASSFESEMREAAEDPRGEEEQSVSVGTGVWDKILVSAK